MVRTPQKELGTTKGCSGKSPEALKTPDPRRSKPSSHNVAHRSLIIFSSGNDAVFAGVPDAARKALNPGENHAVPNLRDCSACLCGVDLLQVRGVVDAKDCHGCIHTYTRVCEAICMRICICICTNVYVHVHMCTCGYAFMCVSLYVYVNAHMYVRMHLTISIYIHTCIYV